MELIKLLKPENIVSKIQFYMEKIVLIAIKPNKDNNDDNILVDLLFAMDNEMLEQVYFLQSTISLTQHEYEIIYHSDFYIDNLMNLPKDSILRETFLKTISKMNDTNTLLSDITLKSYDSYNIPLKSKFKAYRKVSDNHFQEFDISIDRRNYLYMKSSLCNVYFLLELDTCFSFISEYVTAKYVDATDIFMGESTIADDLYGTVYTYYRITVDNLYFDITMSLFQLDCKKYEDLKNGLSSEEYKKMYGSSKIITIINIIFEDNGIIIFYDYKPKKFNRALNKFIRLENSPDKFVIFVSNKLLKRTAIVNDKDEFIRRVVREEKI